MAKEPAVVAESEDTSESVLMGEFFKLCDAGGSIIQIRTREAVRAATVIRKTLLSEDETYTHKEWDAVNGWRTFTVENCTDGTVAGAMVDFYEALSQPLADLRDSKSRVCAEPDKVHCFVYVDPDPYIKDNPVVIALLQQLAAILPSKNVCVILITPFVDMSYLPLGTVLTTDMPTPSVSELERCLRRIIENAEPDSWSEPSTIEDEDITRIATLGLGMTRSEFETHASIAIVQASIDEAPCLSAEILTEGVMEGKTEVVKQSDILELYPAESMDNVAGMGRLKDWIAKRAACFSDEARDFGIAPLKGMAIIGTPGCGKSLVAKAVGDVLGIPVIRLDFGRVFSKFIGDSESRLRAALNMIERMDRLVLFCDEIDKGLGGIGGGSDGGVSSRVLGTFLTWMQEKKSDALVIMTANRVEGLPPELFRRGRLDAVFSVGLPTRTERREILAVHLRKRGRSLEEFDERELVRFDNATNDYIPAEIECAVNDALIAAFNEDSDLTMDHLVEALDDIVPLSTSHRADIDRIQEWANHNATPVNYPEKATSSAGQDDTRRLTRPRRTASKQAAKPDRKLH